MAIQNIILDLGGVLLPVDYHRSAKAFAQLGIENFEQIYSQMKQSDLFDTFETGHTTAAVFRDQIRKLSQKTLSDSQIDHAWNSMILTFPPQRYDFLKALGQHYRLYLLSNTNSIHIRCFTQLFQQQFGHLILDTVFNACYYSSQLGMRKPNADIFEYVLKDQQLQASETLFIDDSSQHVEGARKAGLHSWHLQAPTQIEQLFSGQALLIPYPHTTR